MPGAQSGIGSKNNMQPLSDFVFLKYEKRKETESGVLVSDVSQSKPAKAKVLAVGPGRLDRHGNLTKTTLKKGDIVVVDPFLPLQIKVDDKEYLVIRESQILAKLSPDFNLKKELTKHNLLKSGVANNLTKKKKS